MRYFFHDETMHGIVRPTQRDIRKKNCEDSFTLLRELCRDILSRLFLRRTKKAENASLVR